MLATNASYGVQVQGKLDGATWIRVLWPKSSLVETSSREAGGEEMRGLVCREKKKKKSVDGGLNTPCVKGPYGGEAR